MIYTVTFNPSIDYIVQMEEFKQGEVNRIENEQKYPGGKGINVSRVLNNFNIENIALGFLGGFTGEFIKNFLAKERVKTDFVQVNEDTRINIKLKAQEETEINGSGPIISEEDLQRLYEKLDNLTSEDTVVLAGNVQSSLPRDIYSSIQIRFKDKNAKFVIDTTGEALVCTLSNNPFLIKPNSSELEEIFGVKITTTEEIINYGEKLLNMGAENVIVSMAGEGALLICRDGVYHASAPKGDVKNSVGAGDSLIAGFLAQYSRSKDIVDAFRWGAATGSATAFSLDLCSESYVKELIDQVKITKIN